MSKEIRVIYCLSIVSIYQNKQRTKLEFAFGIHEEKKEVRKVRRKGAGKKALGQVKTEMWSGAGSH